MAVNTQIQYTQEELARIEIRNFINEGLKDAQNGDVQDVDTAFDEIESRYESV